MHRRSYGIRFVHFYLQVVERVCVFESEAETVAERFGSDSQTICLRGKEHAIVSGVSCGAELKVWHLHCRRSPCG